MLALLVTIRDILIALALSWVGISVETRAPTPEQACAATEACERVERAANS